MKSLRFDSTHRIPRGIFVGTKLEGSVVTLSAETAVRARALWRKSHPNTSTLSATQFQFFANELSLNWSLSSTLWTEPELNSFKLNWWSRAFLPCPGQVCCLCRAISMWCVSFTQSISATALYMHWSHTDGHFTLSWAPVSTSTRVKKAYIILLR